MAEKAYWWANQPFWFTEQRKFTPLDVPIRLTRKAST